MKRSEELYYCRKGYLYLIDNLEKYSDESGIDHIKASADFTKDLSLAKTVAGYIDFIWGVHGTDKSFVENLRRLAQKTTTANVGMD